MTIKNGIYKMYYRIKEGSTGQFIYFGDFLTYVFDTQAGTGFSGQKNLYSNGTAYPENISLLNSYFPLNSLPQVFDDTFQLENNTWNSYGECRTQLINIFDNTLGIPLSLPNATTIPQTSITTTNRLYIEYSLKEDFSVIIASGTFYRSGTGGRVFNYAKNSGTDTASALTVKTTFFWYGSQYERIYPVEINASYEYVAGQRDNSFIYAIYTTGTYFESTSDLFQEFENTEPYNPITDPYESGGGSSSIGGGTGTFSETGDIVGIPGLPTLSAVDTGFITLFNPTAGQVKQLASYMWSNSFDMATFKNIVANPIDCILGLTIVPVNPPDAGTKAVSVGNIPTDVNMPYLSSQYVEVDCGTLNVQEFWGSYLDYSPYTKMSLYLPYIGIVPLDIDDVMNATITIKYHVDVLSGACVAYVLCNGTQLYTYIGQCSSNVPITSNDFTNTVNGILGIAGSIGSLVATGGASAPTEIGKIAGNAINALKPNVQKSGAMSGTGGLMGVQTPYLICQRPRQSVPASQNTFTGYPANITATLSDLRGYTEVDKIHLEGVPCTNEEMDEIMTLLESGVYI